MKKLLIFILSICSLASFAQSGAQQFSGVFYRVQDTTAYQTAAVAKHSAGYADIYYNAQATSKHFDVWNGASYDHVFNFNGGSGGGGDTFSGDVTFVLPAGFTLGKYDNGDTAPWTGLTAVEALQDAAIAYLPPTFPAFSISGQNTTVPVGTTLSGAKTFTWTIIPNSGVVSTMDIYNVSTSSTLLAGTPNDGTQSQTITTIQLNTSGATQSWRGIAHDTGTSPSDINSSNFTVTAWFPRYYGPTATAPTNSATVIALPSSAYDTGAGSFTLATGTTYNIFMVCLPPGRSIVSVIDTTVNVDVTDDYDLQTSINVLDAGGTNRAYVIYKCNPAVPYSGSSHNHVVTYN